MLCIGHRGAPAHAPENTLASIGRAFELGADAVEVDVWLLEGELVVLHDSTVDRTTSGRGSIFDLGLEAVRGLDAGGGERIPTLREVIDCIGHGGALNIEMKDPRAVGRVAEELAAARRRGHRPDQFLVSSFDHRALARLRAADPHILVGALIVGLPIDNAAFAHAIGACSVHQYAGCIDEDFVADAHRRGLLVLAYTVNSEAEVGRMAALGVDGVFTDDPLLVEGAGMGGSWPC